MPPTKFQIERPGLYLFQGSRHVAAKTVNEVLVILFGEKKSTTGLVVHSPEDHLDALTDKLETLWTKFHVGLGMKNHEVKAKVFGLGWGPHRILATIQTWLADKGIAVLATDTGKSIVRGIEVDCQSGKVGINYTQHLTHSTPGLLSAGSARMRNPMDTIHAEVLILSNRTVGKTLARQAVEEQRNWAAAVPKNANEILEKKKTEPFPWAVVMIFDDLKDNPKLESFIENVTTTYPSVQVRWVGPSLPSFGGRFPQLKQLPPVDPILLPEFKKQLRAAIFDHELADTSDLLKFQKQKKVKLNR